MRIILVSHDGGAAQEVREGVVLSEEALRHLSPYLTKHVDRFGVYEWNPQRQPPRINYGLPILQRQEVSGVTKVILGKAGPNGPFA